MISPRLAAAVLALFLTIPLGAAAQVRREGPPPRPYSKVELSSPSAEVPMLAGGEVLVEVRVDGKGPYRFALDTGAAGGGRISGTLAKTLGLPVVGKALAGDPSGKNSQEVEIVRTGSLSLGAAAFRDVDLVVRSFPSSDAPEREFDGILGIGLFQELLLTLDYPAHRVRIEKGELLPAAGDKEVVDFDGRRGIPNVTLKIGDVDLPADVDSGNMKGEIVLPASYLGKVPLEKDPVVVGHGRTGFNSFEIKQAPLKGAVRIGGQTVEHPVIDFVEALPHANLGGAFLRRFAVSIDGRNRRIRFRLPAS
ncbi:MAG TPA: retropepsin-like aspartic protease [Thermoanaerobaculia bacterium]|jgi:hypothetical protein|nr:retropepsin-like aspartic protease [Thermoanaerobaculia bacterium]